MMHIPLGELMEAVLMERVNRFLCTVSLDGKSVDAHLHDPGRLKELLLPGAPVLVRREDAPHRKTGYDLVGIHTGEVWASCDSRVPNMLVHRALVEKVIPEVECNTIIPEYVVGPSRIDFCLDHEVLIEVKGVTLVRDGIALFPDAPTRRGTKHIKTLVSALPSFECYLLFIIQRPDAYAFSAHAETDPEFAYALREGARRGVQIMAYTSELVGNSMVLRERIPVSKMYL